MQALENSWWWSGPNCQMFRGCIAFLFDLFVILSMFIFAFCLCQCCHAWALASRNLRTKQVRTPSVKRRICIKLHATKSRHLSVWQRTAQRTRSWRQPDPVTPPRLIFLSFPKWCTCFQMWMWIWSLAVVVWWNSSSASPCTGFWLSCCVSTSCWSSQAGVATCCNHFPQTFASHQIW